MYNLFNIRAEVQCDTVEHFGLRAPIWREYANGLTQPTMRRIVALTSTEMMGSLKAAGNLVFDTRASVPCVRAKAGVHGRIRNPTKKTRCREKWWQGMIARAFVLSLDDSPGGNDYVSDYFLLHRKHIVLLKRAIV